MTADAGSMPAIAKADSDSPAFVVRGPTSIAIRAGTTFAGHAFVKETPVPLPDTVTPGSDLVVVVAGDGQATVKPATSVAACSGVDVLGGFHFAPGGNAPGRLGGDSRPAINPNSAWDVAFRPLSMDPRGMTLVGSAKPFWCDIYLLATDHLANGTSQRGVTIADGNDPPENPAGGRFKKLDYDTAVAVMAHHGKGLLSVEEFFAAAFGVTEKTAADGDPRVTRLDAPRTSAWGLMQATGNLWVWGHDGDPDVPRASMFGGRWWYDGSAGSRYANVAYGWPGFSVDSLGARGRCDHLQPA